MKEERNCTAEFGPEFFNGERGVTFYTYAGWTHGNGKKFNIATPPLYKILPFPYYVSGVPVIITEKKWKRRPLCRGRQSRQVWYNRIG